MLDAAVIGNLLNFPKSVFGFPFGCYATDGAESLSLCLYVAAWKIISAVTDFAHEAVDAPRRASRRGTRM